MQFTRIPSRAWSIAMARVRAMTAPLDTEYGVSPCGRRAEIDEMFTIAPPPLRRMAGMACLLASIMPVTLTRMTCSQSASSTSTTVPRPPIPTLLSRMSSRPHRRTASSTMAPALSARVTSASNTAASPPPCSIMVSVASAAARLTSTRRTLAPSRANRTAAARPLPMPAARDPAPVTIATFPSSRGARMITPCPRYLEPALPDF